MLRESWQAFDKKEIQLHKVKLLIEKYLQHQRVLYYNYINFKKAFDHVWHEGLLQVSENFKFDPDITEVIKALFDDSSSAVLQNNINGDFFHTSDGVRQGYVISAIFFNIYLENRTSCRRPSTTSTPQFPSRRRPLCNLCFADDIDLLGGSEAELQDFTTTLERTAGAHGMEVGSEKSHGEYPHPTSNNLHHTEREET